MTDLARRFTDTRAGVYVFYGDGRPVYLGQTTDFALRMKQHLADFHADGGALVGKWGSAVSAGLHLDHFVLVATLSDLHSRAWSACLACIRWETMI